MNNRVCPYCGGEGCNEEGKQCRYCKGTGTQVVRGDLATVPIDRYSCNYCGFTGSEMHDCGDYIKELNDETDI